jgi:hypothetical protein
MSQGLRGGRINKLFAGLGALLCATVVGCTDVDKPKLGTNTKQPGPGLPGTARLPGQPGSGMGTNNQYGMNGSLQPTGGMGSSGRSPVGGYGATGGTNFGTGSNTNSFVPSVGPNNNYQPIGANPPAGAGLGAGSSGGAGAGYASSPPTLSDLGPPSYPGGSGAPISPPGGQAPLYPNR